MTRDPMGQDERGSAMLEFAIVFPVQLFVVLGLIQLALAYGANQVVQYSAYCAARAAIPDRREEDPPPSDYDQYAREQAEKAAEIAMLPVTWAPLSEATDLPTFLSEVTEQAADQARRTAEYTAVDDRQQTFTGRNVWTSTVTHQYALMIPGVNVFFNGTGGFPLLPWDMDANYGAEPGTYGSVAPPATADPANRMTMMRNATLPMPWTEF